ncbi:MAG: PRC-barrel domain-containing protein [Inquilinaceae bacterium]
MIVAASRTALLAGVSGLVLIAGAARAQDSACTAEIERLEQQIETADLPDPKREEFATLIEGARVADQSTCEEIVAEIDTELSANVEANRTAGVAAGAGAAATAGSTDAGTTLATGAEQAVDATVETAEDLAEDTVDVANEALETAEQATEDAVEPVAEAEMAELGDGTLTAEQIETLRGQDVINLQGEALGDVEEIVALKESGAVHLVVSVGGFLGIGDKDVAIPLERFRMASGERLILPDMTEEELEAGVDYSADLYTPL